MRMLTPFSNSRGFPSDLFSEMDELLNSFRSSSRAINADRTFVPATEVDENDSHYLISMDVPGVKKEDITIDVTNNILTISGERKREERVQTKSGHWVEKAYGSFQRSFSLPTTVDADHIQAHYQDGVLELSLPKISQSRKKTITIESGKSGFFDKLLGAKKDESSH